MIQALPVLRLLKLHFPKSEIYWWIDTALAPLLAADRDLAGIIPFERKRWASPHRWHELFTSILEMRDQRFDWVIDLQGLARSGMFAWLANGDKVIGVEDPREGASGFYDMRVPRPSSATHAVDWYLNVIRHLNIPVHWDFEWMPANEYMRAVVVQKWQPQPWRWMAIIPGARWGNKRWPVEHFTELVKQASGEFPAFRLVILGGKSDAGLGAQIASGAPDRCLNLTGKTTLLEMVEWIRLSEVVVSNDTGPMHIAAALKKPTVALFGPTNPLRTGPYGQVNDVMRIALPCAPCMKDTCSFVKPLECLRGIPPHSVLEVVRQRLMRAAPVQSADAAR